MFDEKARVTCPNCFTPYVPNGISGAAAPLPGMTTPYAPPNGYAPPPGATGVPPATPPMPAAPTSSRVALTGEVIETPAAPTMPPMLPTGYNAPIPPPMNYPMQPMQGAPYPYLAPAQPKKNYTALYVILGSVFGLLFLGAIISAVSFGQKGSAFEADSYRNLNAPDTAAKELLACLRDQSWAKFYYISEFGKPKTKSYLQAQAFATGFKRGLEGSVTPPALWKEKFGGMSDVKTGNFKVVDNHADVPVALTLHFRGQTLPLQGVAHMVKSTDGRWRFNLETVDAASNDPEDGQAVQKAFTDLFGGTQQNNASQNNTISPYNQTQPPPQTVMPYPQYQPEMSPNHFRNRSPYGRGRSPFPPGFGPDGRPLPNPQTPTPPQPATPGGQSGQGGNGQGNGQGGNGSSSQGNGGSGSSGGQTGGSGTGQPDSSGGGNSGGSGTPNPSQPAPQEPDKTSPTSPPTL